MSDVLDILEIDRPNTPEISKDSILGIRKNVPLAKKKEKEGRRPEGIPRELYALLSSDSQKDLPPLLPSDSSQGYKSTKAKLGMRRVRPWKWIPFVNPARKDGAVFRHWRRACDENKEYPFALFNKQVDILRYSDAEYGEHLVSDVWSKADTDVLMELCLRFDLRWPAIQDRWPADLTARSIEDLKERYFVCSNAVKKARNLSGPEGKLHHYDVDHERKRKLQLSKLWDRTPEQIEEEQRLIVELRKIEARKRERERKTQDLQKLINAADAAGGGMGSAGGGGLDPRKLNKFVVKKKMPMAKIPKLDIMSPSLESCTGIKFPDVKTLGVTLQSHRMKLPQSVGQKKMKIIEQLLTEFGIEFNPMAVDEVIQQFNDLRSDMVLMCDLRTILLNYIFELQTLKHQFESLVPGQVLEIPESLVVGTSGQDDSPDRPRAISDVIDAMGTPATPYRKRKAALEQSNMLKKIKART